MRDPRGGLIPLPLPDQHRAPREVAAQAHLHLEDGSELFCLLVHYLLVVVVMARLDQLDYQLNEGVRSEVVGMEIPVLGARSGIFSGSENYIWNNISAVMLANKNQLPLVSEWNFFAFGAAKIAAIC